MTHEEIRKAAKVCAEDCRRKDRLCVFLSPGSGVTYEDCPMRPHKCWQVTVKMWEQAIRDAALFYERIEEDA